MSVMTSEISGNLIACPRTWLYVWSVQDVPQFCYFLQVGWTCHVLAGNQVAIQTRIVASTSTAPTRVRHRQECSVLPAQKGSTLTLSPLFATTQPTCRTVATDLLRVLQPEFIQPNLRPMIKQEPMPPGLQEPIPLGLQEPIPPGLQEPIPPGLQEPIPPGLQEPIPPCLQEPMLPSLQ